LKKRFGFKETKEGLRRGGTEVTDAGEEGEGHWKGKMRGARLKVVAHWPGPKLTKRKDIMVGQLVMCLTTVREV